MKSHARALPAVVAVLFAFLAFAVAPASAAYIEVGQIGGTGPEPNGAGSEDGQFSNPNQADVNDATGVLYVADTGNDRVQSFTPTGTGADFSAKVAITAPSGLAVDQASGDVYVANATGISKLTAALAPAGGWSDPGVTGTLAVDPTTGDLLVADQGANLVRRFNSDGSADGAFSAARPLDLAVDSSGDVLVTTSTGDIISECGATSSVVRFSSAGVEEGTIGSSLVAPGAVDIDPDSGEILVAAPVNGYNCGSGPSPSIVSFDSSGTETSSFQLPQSQYGYVPGLTIRAATGRVYAVVRSPLNDQWVKTKVSVLREAFPPEAAIDPVTTVTGFAAELTGSVDANGKATEYRFEISADGGFNWTSLGTASAGEGEAPVPVEATAENLDPNTAYQARLIASSSDGEDTAGPESFQTPALAPTIAGQGASPAQTEATLTARIATGGLETSYRFEYGPTAAYGSATAARKLPAGSDATEVQVRVNGLTEGTLYHYRVVATNAEGVSTGSDQTFTTKARSAGDPCPNAAIRAEQSSTFLPSCRAYEQVSAVDKAGADVTSYGFAYSTPAAGQLAYSSTGAFGEVAGAPYQSVYVANRSAAGWSTRSISPPSNPVPSLSLAGAVYGVTQDLSKTIFVSTHPLTPGAPPSVYLGNFYVRDNSSNTWELINPEAPHLPYGAPNEFDFTPDMKSVAFDFSGKLTPEAPLGPAVYLYENGSFEMASRLPGGSIPHEAWLGGSGSGPPALLAGTSDNALSRDGSRLFFSSYYTPSSPRSLFMREGETITDISLSQASQPDPLGPAPKTFVGASEDGDRAFFISCEKLTDDSTAVFENGGTFCSHDLYMYETETGELTDLTTTDPNGAKVISAVQISDDGEVVYFAARGDLDGGAGEAGEPKLYAWHDGQIDYVATVSEADFFTIYPLSGTKATADGSSFAFVGSGQMPGVETEGTAQAYVYRLGGSATCVSCDPSVDPAPVEFGGAKPAFQQQVRNLSADGSRLVFQTAMPLSPRDTNGQVDVYLWDDGEVSLISSGQSDRPSELAEVSASGDDIFFFTRQRLLSSDRDALVDVYSARVGGGFPTPPSGPAPCQGSACQISGAAPPAAPALATESARAGNRKPAKRCGKNKRRAVSKGKARCVNKRKPGKKRGGTKRPGNQRPGANR